MHRRFIIVGTVTAEQARAFVGEHCKGAVAYRAKEARKLVGGDQRSNFDEYVGKAEESNGCVN